VSLQVNLLSRGRPYLLATETRKSLSLKNYALLNLTPLLRDLIFKEKGKKKSRNIAIESEDELLV
jgi:hypothetical protein